MSNRNSKVETTSVSPADAKRLVNCRRENGLKFSLVDIKKLVNNSWVAEFDYTFNDQIKPFKMAIHGTSSENVLKRVEGFLETKLNYYELSVHGS